MDVFCREEVFAPLATSETMFLPAEKLADRIAPTLGNTSGTVQDRNARRLGGVAGHAGLFSSARDLARFARLMLNGGEIDGKRILSERVVKEMITPVSCGDGTVMRGLGWDINSPFSSPRGKLFSEASFGHTGYSGSSIWIDPKQDLFVVLLTNRLDYRNVRMFNQLRADISTVAVAAFRKTGDNHVLTSIPQRAMMTTAPQRKITRGIPAAYRGKRLIAALSGTDRKVYGHYGNKTCKNHHGKSYGRTRRCGSGKRRIRCT